MVWMLRVPERGLLPDMPEGWICRQAWFVVAISAVCRFCPERSIWSGPIWPCTDGLVIFSCFGEKTLELLRKAYGTADAYSHVLPFRSMQAIGDDLVRSGFSAPVLEREWITVTYTEIERLLSDVRALGGNPLSSRPVGLTGKRACQRLLDMLEAERTDDGILSLAFEVIYAHAFREAEPEDAGKMIRLLRE